MRGCGKVQKTKWSSPRHSCVVDDGSEGRGRPESGPAVTRQWRFHRPAEEVPAEEVPPGTSRMKRAACVYPEADDRKG